MANPIVELLRGIWSCVRGSLRFILFFSCLLFVVVQFRVLVSQFTDNSLGSLVKTNLLDQPPNLSSHIAAFALLFIALLGTYGAFYNHQRSLKTFAVLVAITSLILTISLSYTMMGDDFEQYHDKFIDRMKNFSTKYDWTGNKYPAEQPTIAWDLLQKLECCGLNGPQDWDKTRPEYISDDLYPFSCCDLLVHRLCPKNSVYKTGCMETIQAIEALTLMMTIAYVAFQFLLCIIAYVLILPSGSDSRSTSSQGPVLPQDYQRFEGSVYVRQPAVAPQYQQQQQPMLKSSVPPMYPNVHDIEKKSASSPPPSYY